MGMFLVSFVILVALVTVLSGIGVCERCSIGNGGVYSMISTVLGGQVGGTIGLLYIFGQVRMHVFWIYIFNIIFPINFSLYVQGNNIQTANSVALSEKIYIPKKEYWFENSGLWWKIMLLKYVYAFLKYSFSLLPGCGMNQMLHSLWKFCDSLESKVGISVWFCAWGAF